MILVSSTLVEQWRVELKEKSGLTFATTNSPLFRRDPGTFWKSPFILASIQTAKSRRNFEAAVARGYDLVIVDEAHHLKNRRTLIWKLVNTVKKNFLLLLTATPVQNKLEELYNLITLLKPGHLKTRKAFMAEFVTRGNPTDPRNREKLRGLLKEVMIRNTRSIAQLRLPPRFATTVRVSPSSEESGFYEAISAFGTERSTGGTNGPSRWTFRRLLEAAVSSVSAALSMLRRMAGGDGASTAQRARERMEMGRCIDGEAKLNRVREILCASPEKKTVYVNYTATLEHLHGVLGEEGIPRCFMEE